MPVPHDQSCCKSCLPVRVLRERSFRADVLMTSADEVFCRRPSALPCNTSALPNRANKHLNGTLHPNHPRSAVGGCSADDPAVQGPFRCLPIRVCCSRSLTCPHLANPSVRRGRGKRRPLRYVPSKGQSVGWATPPSKLAGKPRVPLTAANGRRGGNALVTSSQATTIGRTGQP